MRSSQSVDVRLSQLASQVIVAQANGRWRSWGRRLRCFVRRRLSGRSKIMYFCNVDGGARLVGNVDGDVVLSSSCSQRKRNRVADTRRSAEALVRNAVCAPVGNNQVLPMWQELAQGAGEHMGIGQGMYRERSVSACGALDALELAAGSDRRGLVQLCCRFVVSCEF